jgi:hypothetical protein
MMHALRLARGPAARLVGLALLAALGSSCGGGDQPFTPYAPPPLASPAVDEPYLQEFNHTTNEVEAGIGPLVAVVLPPALHAGFDQPTQVTPRGVVRHEAGAPTILEIPTADADLIGAAATATGLFVVGPTTVYEVGTDGSFTAHAVPAALTATGMVPGVVRAWILTDGGLGSIEAGAPPTWPPALQGAPLAALERDDLLVMARADGLTGYDLASPDTPRWTVAAAELTTGPVRALVGPVALPQALDLVVIGDDGVQGFSLAGGTPAAVEVPEFTAGRVPLGQPRAAAVTSDGGFVVATAGGAYRIMERGIGPEWRVYNQERWLPSEDVRGLATDPGVADGPLWFATAAGLATVTAVRMTLEEKLGAFVDRIVRRHDRDGAVADSHLTRRGDLSSNVPWDSDNDGSWTSYWLVAECFRWQVTGAADAKANFDRSLDAMLRLRDVTGTDWFLARAVIRKATCNLDDCDNPDDGKWFTSPDGEWWVKRDTSNDEVIAHVFMMGHAYDLCADATQQARIAAHIGGIVGGIMDHGWQLLDPVTGLVTTYGQFDPQYVNEGFEGPYGDGGVRAVEILAGLTLAHYMTGEQRFLDGKQELMDLHGYADNAVAEATYLARPKSSDNDEMATYGWFVLLRYEPDPALRARWLDGWRLTYAPMKLHQAAWWDMVNAVVGGDAPDVSNALRWLRLAPLDMIRWDMHNSHRLDLVQSPAPHDDGSIRSDGRIIPYDERRCDRWNTDQFRVDGGMGGMIEMDGADVLAPYWMGRSYGFIVPVTRSGATSGTAR